MKFAKRLVVLAMAAMMVFGMVACGGSSDESAVKVYTMDGKFNSEEVNQWRNLYLVDEDTYILELEVLNSKDTTKHTVEFVMRGNYTLDGTTITLEPGYGNGYAMNGESQLPCTCTPAEPNAMFEAMFGVNGAMSFTLNDDGTYLPVE